MDQKNLAECFEANRWHLRSVAHRMLGSSNEADDAVQEAWLRLSRGRPDDVENLAGWLTTVVGRVCLDMLRARKTRAAEPIGPDAEAVPDPADAEQEVMIADSIGVAMLVVLEALLPAERVAFVLHDMFNLPFEAIAQVVGRSPAAARQLASRARRRVRAAPGSAETDDTRQREVVGAFLAASRNSDFSALLALLDPSVVLRADAAAIQASLARANQGDPTFAPEVRGQAAVARTFAGSLRAARLALVDGDAGLVIAPGGRARMVFDFVSDQGKIVEISVVAEAERIDALDLEY